MVASRQRTGTGAASGFTLVEVALAVVVVALGILAVFGLLSAGLDQSSKAIAETEAAIFADNVFHGLGAISLALADIPTTVTNYPWEAFWRAASFGMTNIPVTAPDAWEPVGASVVETDGLIHTNEYVSRTPTFRGSSVSVKNHFMRYSLSVQLRDAVPGGGSKAGLWTNRASCSLRVWRGRFGELKEPIVFYEEFTNPGDL